MQIMLKIKPEATEALQKQQGTTDASRTLLQTADELGVTLEPVQPGEADPTLELYIGLEVAAPLTGEAPRAVFGHGISVASSVAGSAPLSPAARIIPRKLIAASSWIHRRVSCHVRGWAACRRHVCQRSIREVTARTIAGASAAGPFRSSVVLAPRLHSGFIGFCSNSIVSGLGKGGKVID